MSPKNRAAVALGRKGGKRKSAAKVEAVRKNIAKATQARIEKRKQSEQES
jgi:RNase adaptor protein for sRNA GlmZ degradation